MRKHRSPRQGFVLIAFALALVLILGAVGLTFDIGRMYITKEESQAYCDSAAIAATLKLDGTPTGLSNATNAALATVKGWQFGTTPFNTSPVNIEVTFGRSPADTFVTAPLDPTGYVCGRVTVTNVRLPMGFMPVLTNELNAIIAATATAMQLPASGARRGVFPFSPYVHPVPYSPDAPTATGCDPNCLTGPGEPDQPMITPPNPAVPPDPPDPLGLIPAIYRGGDGQVHRRHGGVYTLQWASGALKVPPDANDLKNGVVCPGDYDPLSTAIGKATGELHGYIWKGDGTSTITDNILNSVAQGRAVWVDQTLIPAEGDKEAITKALNERVQRDADTASRWYIDYLANRETAGTVGVGEWRVITVPVNTGCCDCPLDGGYTNPCSSSYKVVQFAKFFLQTDYDMGGNKAICSEYVGTSSGERGAGGPGPGLYVVRLVQ